MIEENNHEMKSNGGDNSICLHFSFRRYLSQHVCQGCFVQLLSCRAAEHQTALKILKPLPPPATLHEHNIL